MKMYYSTPRKNTVIILVILSIICYPCRGHDNQPLEPESSTVLAATQSDDDSTRVNASQTHSNQTLIPTTNQTEDILYLLRRDKKTTPLYPTRTRKKRVTKAKTKPLPSTTTTTTTRGPPISYSFANTIFIPDAERNETLKKVKVYFDFRYGIPEEFHDFYIWYYGVKQDKEADDRRQAVAEPSYTPGYYTRLHLLHHTPFHVPTEYWDTYIRVNDLAGRTTDPTPFTLPKYFTFAPTPSPIATRRTYPTLTGSDLDYEYQDKSFQEIKRLAMLIRENEEHAENGTIVMKLFRKLMAQQI